jgi:hypothetical protein
MKTKKEIKEKEFDTVTTFRKIKEYLRVNSLKINSN